MKPLYLTEKELEKIKKGKILGIGSMAYIYDYQGYALKVYRNNNYYYDTEAIIEKLIKLNLNLKHIISPIQRVYFPSNGPFSYLMLKVYGETINNTLNFDLLLYAQALIELNQDLITIARNKILIRDTHKENILYQECLNKANLFLIDTDDWDYRDDLAYEEVFKRNLEALMPCLKVNFSSRDLYTEINQKIYDENYLPLYAEYLITMKSIMQNHNKNLSLKKVN